MKTVDVEVPKGCGVSTDSKYTYGAANRHIKGCTVDVSLTLGNSKLNKYPIFMVTEMGPHVYGAMPKSLYSGRLGIAGFEATWKDQVPVLKTMINEGLIISKEVGLYMPAKADATGKINIGDPSQVEEIDQNKVVVMPNIATKKQAFEIHVDAVKVNGNIVYENIKARLDSSQSGIYYPYESRKEIRDKLYSQTSGNAWGSVPCENQQVLTFSIRGQEFTINPEDLVHKAAPGEGDGGECTADVRPYYNMVDYWVFGTGFFHNVYPSFNLEKGEVKLFGLKS